MATESPTLLPTDASILPDIIIALKSHPVSSSSELTKQLSNGEYDVNTLLEWIVDELVQSKLAPTSLDIRYAFHPHTDSDALYIYASDETLLQGAEKLGMRKRLDLRKLGIHKRKFTSISASSSQQSFDGTSDSHEKMTRDNSKSFDNSKDKDSIPSLSSVSEDTASTSKSPPADFEWIGARIRSQMSKSPSFAYREFSIADADLFEGFDQGIRNFFTSLERQTIVLHMLYSLRFNQGNLNRLKHCCDNAAHQIIAKFSPEEQLFPSLLRHRFLRLYGLHEQDKIENLRTRWANPRQALSSQPFDDIKQYFGANICIYFAWLGHYTKALIVPAILGLVVWFWTDYNNPRSVAISFMLTSFSTILWATIYIESWKRYSSTLAFRWGALDAPPDTMAPPRPEFRGPLKMNELTGRKEPQYSDTKRMMTRYLVTFPVIGLCLFCVIFSLFTIFQLQLYIARSLQATAPSGSPANVSSATSAPPGTKHLQTITLIFDSLPLFKPPLLGFALIDTVIVKAIDALPKVLLAVVVLTFEKMYRYIAVWLTGLENYRLEDEYRNQFILKLVLFHFLNSFFSLFMLAFYAQNLQRLHEFLIALFGMRQVLSLFQETIIPFAIMKYKEMKLSRSRKLSLNKETKPLSPPTSTIFGSDGSKLPDIRRLTLEFKERARNGNAPLTQCEFEEALPQYEDTYDDYLEMFMQFGYLSLFGPLMPLAALFALINNICEVRSDAFKLVTAYRRPFTPFGADASSHSVGAIGIWLQLFEGVAIVAIITNGALIGVAGHLQVLFPALTPVQVVLILVLCEHLIIFFRLALAIAIPDRPEWLENELAKMEYLRRSALHGVYEKLEHDIVAKESTLAEKKTL